MRQAELVRYLVLAAQREGNRRLTRELTAAGVTPTQSEVLGILGDYARLSLTGLVDRLVGAGLVELAVDGDDRPHVTLTLTGPGRTAEAAVREIDDRLDRDLDAATAGLDLGPVIHALRVLSTGEPAGSAVESRLSTSMTRSAIAAPPTLAVGGRR